MARRARTHMPGEAFRYMGNAQEIVGKCPVEDNFYTDIKPVREAFSTAYLAILEAIDEALINKGLHRKDLPKSVDAYRDALRKQLSVNNGKLMREFDYLYDGLHIAGYYRGLIHETNAVKDYFSAAEKFIKKLIPSG
ncbi:DUF5618 family protein [Candidatus Magnetomonas plexicatena]|uniref:DUF5618 family protein n=1 Tax=Candidatus Magnetomonas plexicatena TaxID=2552947 RepID=UPI0011025D3A|nr:hypothetical protein E2O03_009955 [Nitrospirales bacterium LBB_01]